MRSHNPYIRASVMVIGTNEKSVVITRAKSSAVLSIPIHLLPLDVDTITVKFPKNLHCTIEEEYETSRWEWKTVFTQLSGKGRWFIMGSGHIVDHVGKVWKDQYNGGFQYLQRGDVNLANRRSGSSVYWCNGDQFRGGYAIFFWEGISKDGRNFKFTEKVNLVCPNK